MNQLIQSITCLVFLFSLSNWGHAQTVHYVNPSATGTNDGSSWENAFTDLQTPLSAASAGDEIWVVSGTYSPSPTDQNRSASFTLNNQVHIYGGFAGTESSVDERDLSTNPTILSGDNAENDGVDPDSAALADNAYTILQAVSSSASGTSIDGIVFARAYGALIDSVEVDSVSRGGAIFSRVALDIRNCTFTNNFSIDGGAIYWNTSMAGSKIESCQFIENEARDGGALFLEAMEITIDDVAFRNNESKVIFDEGGSGGAVFTSESVAFYSAVIFEENTAEEDGGAICGEEHSDSYTECMFIMNAAGDRAGAIHTELSEMIYRNVLFEQNVADDDAGAISNRATNDSFVDCSFRFNSTGDRAGAIYCFEEEINDVNVNGTHIFIDCIIEGNSAEDDGGFLVSSGGMGSVELYNCEVFNNTGADNGGVFFSGFERNFDHLIKLVNSNFRGNVGDDGGVVNIQRNVIVEIDSCSFSNNSAEDDGGAITIGNQNSFRSSTLDVRNSRFEMNSCVDGGGAIDIFGDSSAVYIANTTFLNNSTVEGTGGAIEFDGNHEILIEDCSFELNNSAGGLEDGAGGAIDANGGGEIIDGDYGSLHIRNCLFEGNSAGQEGGALAVETYNTTIVNSIFAYNETFSEGFGTIMQIGGEDTSKLTLINNSFAYNLGTASAGLAQSRDVGNDSLPGSFTETYLLNNIFYNPGSSNYANAMGTSEVMSWGGNMYHDNSFDTLDNNPVVFFDINNPYVGAFGDFDYTIADTSFAANKGVYIEGVTPDNDFTGATRITSFDSLITAGAYEVFIDSTTSVYNPGHSTYELSVWPNVTNNEINLKFENEHRGLVKVMVMDLSGRVMVEFKDEKRSNQFKRTYQVGNLPSGMYLIRTMSENQIGDARFMVSH